MGFRKLLVGSALVGAASLLAPGLVLAEGTPLEPEAHGGEPVGMPPPGGGGAVPVEEQPQVQDQRAQGRGIEYGGHLLVGVPLHGVFSNDFGVGFGIHGRIGWELPGGFSIEANIGFLYLSALDPDATAYSEDVAGIGALYFGGGVRYAILNPSAIVPFVGAGLGLNYWVAGDSTAYQGRSGQVYCGSGVYCDAGDGRTYDQFSGLSLLANASAGIIYELTSDIAVEAGAQYNFQFTEGPFSSARNPRGGYLTIFAGGTLYY